MCMIGVGVMGSYAVCMGSGAYVVCMAAMGRYRLIAAVYVCPWVNLKFPEDGCVIVLMKIGFHSTWKNGLEGDILCEKIPSDM